MGTIWGLKFYRREVPLILPPNCAGLPRMCQDEFGAKKKPFGFFSVTYGLLRTFSNIHMVPKAGIEPARLAAVDFESTASTDFATSALKGMRKTLGIIPLPSLHATTIRTDVMQVLKKSAPELNTSHPSLRFNASLWRFPTTWPGIPISNASPLPHQTQRSHLPVFSPIPLPTPNHTKTFPQD